MKYFNAAGEIFAFDQSDIDAGFPIPDGAVEIPEAEALAIAARAPTVAIAASRQADSITAAMALFLAAGFTCSNGISMQATDDHIRRLDDGWRLAHRLNQTTMDVRDINNVRHRATPLAEVEVMVNEMGANWMKQWNRKCTLQERVQAVAEANVLPKADPGYMDDATARAGIEAVVW